MTAQDKATLKGYFNTGDTPTESNFADLIDTIPDGLVGDLTKFNVKDYGAIGDGVADDTTHIQDAINAAHLAGGGIVWFPVGIHLSDPLTLHENISLQGANEWVSVVKSRSAGSLFVMHSTVTRAELGVFQDIRLDGDGIGNVGIDLIGSDRLYMTRVFVENFIDAAIHVQGTLISTFNNCTFLANGLGVWGSAYTLTGGMGRQSSNLVQFNSCSFNFNTIRGIQWVDGAQLLLNSCNLESNGTNGNSDTGAIYYRPSIDEPDLLGLHLFGCWFELNHGDADVTIEEIAFSGIRHVIETTLFNPTSYTTYGIRLKGASNDAYLNCTNVMVDSGGVHSGGDFFADGAHSEITLNNCIGTQVGSGTFVIGSGITLPDPPDSSVFYNGAGEFSIPAGGQSESVNLGNAGMLAYAAIASGDYSLTGSTLHDLDATNAKITFNAPASGKVLVRLSATADPGTSVDWYQSWGIREGETTLAGGASDSVSVRSPQGGSHSIVGASKVFEITGLSAGEHTFKWAVAQSAGTGGIVANANSPAFMEVWVENSIPVPTEIGVTADATDAKTYTWLNGWYIVGPNTANMPFDGLWWYVNAFVTEDSSVLLQAFGTSGAGEDSIFTLREENGTWNPEWVKSGGIPDMPTMYVEDLSDVNLTTPQTDGQVLVWDEATSMWIPSTPSSGGSVPPTEIGVTEDSTDVKTYAWLTGWYIVGPNTANMPFDGYAWYVNAFVTEDSGVLLQATGIGDDNGGATFILRKLDSVWNTDWISTSPTPEQYFSQDPMQFLNGEGAWVSPATGLLVPISRGNGEFRNIAIGNQVLQFAVDISGKSPQDNTAIGDLAMQYNTSGMLNTVIGGYALNTNTTGDHNTAIGYYALLNSETGGGNTAVGCDALISCGVSSVGEKNTAIGYGAGGHSALGEGGYLHPTESIYVGFDSKGLLLEEANAIVIGTNVVGQGSNTTSIGNDNTTLTKLYGTLEVARERIRIDQSHTPESATDSGTEGEICWDADYVYVCVAANTWKRSAISSWS